MWKIQTAVLQRTRGRAAAGLMQRVLLPTTSTTATAAASSSTTTLSDFQSGGSSSVSHACSVATGMHRNRRCYSQTSRSALEEQTDKKTLTLPSNLMFDFKSSFAPQRNQSVATEELSSLLAEDGRVEDDKNHNEEKTAKKGDDNESSESSSELDDDYDDYKLDGDDDEIPLLFYPDPLESSKKRLVKPLPERLQVPIRVGTSSSSEEAGTIWLDPTIFGVEDIRIDLIVQNVNYIRNKIRGFRKAKSKTISEVSGSGRKVRNQKGGGIARAGHSRPAHWRGGAKAHGPKNTKNYGNTKLNKRVKALAIRSVLSQKLMEGNLILVDHLLLDSHKTGPWTKVLEAEYGVGKALRGTKLRNNPHLSQTTTGLILDHYLEPKEGSSGEEEEDYHASYQGVPINLWVASSNIPRVTVQNQRFLNVYDLLKNEKLILTLSALKQIEEKWSEK